MLGGIQGVDDQIAYTRENPEWYLPARYFAKRIGRGKTAINLVVADTSSFIDGARVDLCVRPASAEQVVLMCCEARTSSTAVQGDMH